MWIRECLQCDSLLSLQKKAPEFLGRRSRADQDAELGKTRERQTHLGLLEAGAGTCLLPQSTARAWCSGSESVYQLGLIREI